MTSSTTLSGTILLLSLPPKTFVGIDLISFNSSPNFHGIVNVPSGLHCLYTGTDASLSIRHCSWLKIDAQSSTHVLQWDHATESLTRLEPDSERFKAAARSIPSLRGRGLVNYIALQDASSDLQEKDSINGTGKNADSWPLLSCHITTRALDRILGEREDGAHVWNLSSISTAPKDQEAIPGLSTEEAAEVLHDTYAGNLNMVAINLKQTWPEDSIGRDRTEKARDRSWYLGHLLDTLTAQNASRQAGAKELLAEFQLCFIMVLVLANYSCLEQWKRILSVLLTCQAALRDVEGFFIEVLRVLRAQLERIDDVEDGLFEMGDEAGSAWLRGLLKTFKANVDEIHGEEAVDNGLSKELSELRKWLRDTYGWEDAGSVLRRGMVDLEDGERVELQMDGLDEDEETGEYAPVVVEA